MQIQCVYKPKCKHISYYFGIYNIYATTYSWVVEATPSLKMMPIKSSRSSFFPLQIFLVKKSATLQATNTSHLGNRKIIFKSAFLEDMLIPWRVMVN